MNTSLILPKITVITPSYNQANFIDQTIQSVLSQNYPNLVYIIMDGGSTDGTIEILKRYNSQLVWFSEKDRGQSHAINKGLRRSTGDVIAYLNSDDVYEPGTLLAVGEFFADHPDACWLTGWCSTVNTQGKEIRKLSTLYKKFWLFWRSYKALLVLDYVSQPATFWRREVIEKVGEFNESLHFAMDYDYSLRVGKHFKLRVLPRYLARYRVHHNSKTFSSTESINAQFDEDLEIARKNGASRILTGFHTFHNSLIALIYRGYKVSSS